MAKTDFAAKNDALHGPARMILGVVSDTHGHLDYARQAVRMLDSLSVEAVLHCGDIGSPEIVPLFADWPTHFVFGNVDYDVYELRAAIQAAGQTCHGLCGDLTLAGVRIGLLHGHDGARLQQMIASGKWQLICYGHTHVAERHQAGPTWVLNPGALYRANPHSLAVVDLQDMAIQHVTL
jgi:hypothetical protein